MAMKLFFMDELQVIKNESLTSANIRNTSTNIDYGTVDSLQTKIKLLETKNKLLKDDIKNKLKLIHSIQHNSNLIQGQYFFAQKETRKTNRKTNVTRKTIDKSISHTTGNNAFRNDRMSQTFQRITDLKNCKLNLKTFILRLINQK